MTVANATGRQALKGRRVGPLDALIDIAALEPDGLIVTTDGTYVRIIDCDFVPNPITADPSDIATIEAGWASIFAAIPDHQALSLYAQTDPIPIDDAIAEDEARVSRAIADDLAADPPSEELARTRRRFLQAQRQSVLAASSGEQPAVQARYWIAVRWRPEIPIKQRFRDACTPPTAGAPHQLGSAPGCRSRQPAVHRADRRPARRPRDRPAHRRARREPGGPVGAPAPSRADAAGLRRARRRRPHRAGDHARGRGGASPADRRCAHAG